MNSPSPAELAEKLHEVADLMPPDRYYSVSATWTTGAGTLMTLSISSTDPADGEQ